MLEIEMPRPTRYTLAVTPDLRAATDLMPVCLPGENTGEAIVYGRIEQMRRGEIDTIRLPFAFAIAEIDAADRVVRVWRAVRG